MGRNAVEGFAARPEKPVRRIGVSGHRAREGADWVWTRNVLVDLFLEHEGAIGWSSLAPGADVIFAEVALAYGGGHVMVEPVCAGGVLPIPDAREAARAMRLTACSQRVVKARDATPDAAYRKAGERVVRAVDLMVVIWDGAPARGEGGTGDIADFSKAVGRRTIWIDPIQRKISQL